jgi:hypothetical protein
MARLQLLRVRNLRWFLERKAAVLEAGGTIEDVRTACCQTGSLRAALPCLLLYQRSGCAASRRSSNPDTHARRVVHGMHAAMVTQAAAVARMATIMQDA